MRAVVQQSDVTTNATTFGRVAVVPTKKMAPSACELSKSVTCHWNLPKSQDW